jgi:hypothetical protein
MGSNVKRVCCLRRADLRARFEGMAVVLMCMGSKYLELEEVDGAASCWRWSGGGMR